jgi:hypothetical protein
MGVAPLPGSVAHRARTRFVNRFELHPQGRFSLAASIRFLEHFPPSDVRPVHDSQLHRAFPLEGSWEPVTASLSQGGPVLEISGRVSGVGR